MRVIKDISIKDASGSSFDSRNIGAEAQNIDVSYDNQGKIIPDIEAAGVTVSTTKPLSETLKDFEEKTIAVEDLSNTNINNLTNGQSLVYNSTSDKWENKEVQGGGGASTLTDLTDTTISSPANGQGLIYNSSSGKWVNQNISTGATSLANLTDTSISSPSSGQGLVYNSSTGKWTNGSLTQSLSSLSDTSISGASSGQVLTYNGSRWVNQTSSASGKMETDGSNASSSVNMSSTSSFRVGYGNTASGSYSQAVGYQTNAAGAYSHAEGYRTCALGEGAHAEGYQTCAVGQGAHAEGLQTTANGLGAHAAGSRSYANGSYSVALGNLSKSTNYSIVMGYGAGTTSYSQSGVAMGSNVQIGIEGNETAARYSIGIGENIKVGGGTVAIGRNINGHTSIQNTGFNITSSTLNPDNVYHNDTTTLQYADGGGDIRCGNNIDSGYGYMVGIGKDLYLTGMRFKARGIVNGVTVDSSKHKIYFPKGSVHWLIANTYLNTTGAYRGTNSYLITVNGGGSSSSALAAPKATAFGATGTTGINLTLGADSSGPDGYSNGTYKGYVTIGSCTTACKVEYAIIPILTPFGDFATTFS